MSIGKVTQALQIINEVVKSKATVIETPISLHKYTITPLQGKDEQELRQIINPRNSDSKISETLYTYIYKHIQEGKNINDENLLGLEDFLKSESVFDVVTLFHALNISTYDYIKDYEYTCPYCETVNKIEKIKYKDFMNTSEKWDKQKPFNEYTLPVKIKINDVKITINTKIPSLFHELAVTRKVLTNTTTNMTEQNLPMMYTLNTSNLERCLLIINEMKIKKKDLEEDIVLTNIFDIKAVLEVVTENILEEILDKYNEHFSKYVPNYMYKTKCSACEKEIEIPYHPVLEFITRVLS